MFRCGRVNPTSGNDRKRAMGSVADRIAKKIVSHGGSKVVDLGNWREARKMAIEAGIGDDGLALGKLPGHDICHAVYVAGENDNCYRGLIDSVVLQYISNKRPQRL